MKKAHRTRNKRNLRQTCLLKLVVLI